MQSAKCRFFEGCKGVKSVKKVGFQGVRGDECGAYLGVCEQFSVRSTTQKTPFFTDF